MVCRPTNSAFTSGVLVMISPPVVPLLMLVVKRPPEAVKLVAVMP